MFFSEPDTHLLAKSLTSDTRPSTQFFVSNRQFHASSCADLLKRGKLLIRLGKATTVPSYHFLLFYNADYDS